MTSGNERPERAPRQTARTSLSFWRSFWGLFTNIWMIILNCGRMVFHCGDDDFHCSANVFSVRRTYCLLQYFNVTRQKRCHTMPQKIIRFSPIKKHQSAEKKKHRTGRTSSLSRHLSNYFRRATNHSYSPAICDTVMMLFHKAAISSPNKPIHHNNRPFWNFNRPFHENKRPFHKITRPE